ncbi:MAG: hypothetical protein P1P87_08060 [Trueperaceae bacterium]|nr:hypothetical protein [Trueperaceae bacterium]
MRPTLLALALLALALLVLLAAPAVAADLHVLVGADADGPTARVALGDLCVGDDRFDVGAAWSEGAGALAAGWRRTLAAGPVGNLLAEGAVGVAGLDGAGLRADVDVGLRGVAGPVALGVRLAIGTRPPFGAAVWDVAPDPAPVADPRKRTGADPASPFTALAATLTWRIDRRRTWTAEPTGAWTAAGWTGAVATTLRWAGVGDDLDVAVAVDAAQGAAARHLAVGVTLHHVPRRAPASSATAWWGTGSAGTGAGAEVDWTVRRGPAEVALAAGWGPPWSDRDRAYASLRASAPATRGRWSVAVAWLGDAGRVAAGWSLPLAR